jgi:hypothetical protein
MNFVERTNSVVSLAANPGNNIQKSVAILLIKIPYIRYKIVVCYLMAEAVNNSDGTIYVSHKHKCMKGGAGNSGYDPGAQKIIHLGSN